jgi:hypothetical protein
VEPDSKTRGHGEVVKDFFEVGHMAQNDTNDDESIIGILEDVTGKVAD